MIQRCLKTLPIALCLAACGPQASPIEAPVASASETVNTPADLAIAGEWTGLLEAGSQTLRLNLDIDLDTPPAVITLTSVDQGGARFEMEIVRINGSQVHFSTSGLALSYEGVLQDGVITGTFNQGGLSVPLVFEPLVSSGSAEARNGSAPAPLDPRDAALTVELADGRLAGALLTAEDATAGVLIISGSGPQDRNGIIGGPPVYAALARALGDADITSLRLDDRMVGGSQAPAPLSPADLAADAALALDALREQTGLACVGLVGHSEGAILALLAAEQAQPDFIVSLAGSHEDLETTLLRQSEAMILASGQPQAAADANRALQTAVFEAIRSSAPGETRAAIEAVILDAGLPESVAAREAATWGQPYAIALFSIDPAPLARAYPGPLLAVFADKDLQVLAEPTRNALDQARGDLPTRVVTLQGVNHLFQEAQTGLPDEYANAAHAMSPQALDVITAELTALIGRACQ